VSEALDRFGRLVMETLRDRAFETADMILSGDSKAPSLATLQAGLARLDDGERELARRLVRIVLDSAIHDFLFALHELHEADRPILLLADGEDVAASSDGLHGEAFGDTGWQSRFSRYGRAPDEA